LDLKVRKVDKDDGKEPSTVMDGEWIIRGSRPQEPLTEEVGMWRENALECSRSFVNRESHLSRIRLDNAAYISQSRWVNHIVSDFERFNFKVDISEEK
jgi:hypothetical protein